MAYDVSVEGGDYVANRDVPARSMMKLMGAMAAGTGLFFFAFHMLAWAVGMPGPFLSFGSGSRWSDIVRVSLGMPLSMFMVSFLGLAVVKALAMLNCLNFRLKVR